MTLKASDLSEGTKRQILDEIRNRLGQTQYQQMIDSLGEDGLINAILTIETANKSETSVKRKGGKASSFFSTTLVVIGAALIFCGFFWATDNFEHWYGKIVTGILLIPFLLWLTGFSIPEEFIYILVGIIAILISAALIILGIVQGLS